MGKCGPKPSFVNVACPNKDCKDYGNMVFKRTINIPISYIVDVYIIFKGRNYFVLV